MASKTTTTWTCDRCGTRRETSCDFPGEWKRLVLLFGLRFGDAQSSRFDVQICADCGKSAELWLNEARGASQFDDEESIARLRSAMQEALAALDVGSFLASHSNVHRILSTALNHGEEQS